MATIHCCVHHFMFIHRWASSISVPILFKHIFNHFPFKSLCTKTRTTIFVWVMAGERCLNVWLLFVNIYLYLYLAKQNSNYLQFVITSAKHQYQAVLPTQEINTHNNLNHCDIISWITAWWDCYSRRAVIVWKRQVIIWGRGEGGCLREGYYSRKYDGILTENGIWCSHINRMNDKNSKEDYPTLKPTFPENFQTEK